MILQYVADGTDIISHNTVNAQAISSSLNPNTIQGPYYLRTLRAAVSVSPLTDGNVPNKHL